MTRRATMPDREKHYGDEGPAQYWELTCGAWRQIDPDVGGDWPNDTFTFTRWSGPVPVPLYPGHAPRIRG